MHCESWKSWLRQIITQFSMMVLKSLISKQFVPTVEFFNKKGIVYYLKFISLRSNIFKITDYGKNIYAGFGKSPYFLCHWQ